MSSSDFDKRVLIAEKLIAFKERDKFSAGAWGERGLQPSDIGLSNTLQQVFDQCSEDLLEGINNNLSKRALRSTIVSALKKIDKDELDTEEKETVAELMFELSNIVEVDIKDKLNSWLYGALMSTFIKAGKILSSLKGPFPTVIQPCTKCRAELKLLIKRRNPDMPSFSFDVLKCDQCGELNLFDRQPGIGLFNYENATIVEHLDRKKYTKEQALIKMEEMKDQK